ncbi:MAG: imidazole glycerol phosphate synthase subunit HisH [Candidatus Xiphinematobacter sp.]|nr:MAG: imidazole glycerol phosphate synthase subunit HisH [Candidatus Xiphinematobacter sp.]
MKRGITVGLVDYGSSNLRSVRKALEVCGAAVHLVDQPVAFDSTQWSALVVPGVGSFGHCVQSLRTKKLWLPILRWIEMGHPYLGICLGYHLLFESSEESPETKGFGLLAGRVVSFPRWKVKVPHVGWNELTVRQPVLFDGIELPVSVYFIHSYYPIPQDSEVISSECEYGVRFAASITKGRVVATQFHPEKSQSAGLRFIANFLHSLQPISLPAYATSSSN